jgi:hypothetical protein
MGRRNDGIGRMILFFGSLREKEMSDKYFSGMQIRIRNASAGI